MKMLEMLRAKYAELFQSKRDAAQQVIDDLAEKLTAESRTATDEAETAEYRAALDTIEAIDADTGDAAELRKEIARLEAVARATVEAPTAPTFIRKPDTPTPTDVRSLSRGEARDAARRLLDEARGDIVTDANKAHLERMLTRERTGDFDGDVIAKRLLLTENEHYRAAFAKGVTHAQPVFTPEEARAINEFRAMSIGTDAAGGYGVPVLIDPTIILTSGAADAPLLRLARIETITNDEWEGVSSAGVSWSFDAEAAAVSDDSPTLAQPTVVAHMARGFIPYSIQVGSDYPGFAMEMGRLLDQGYVDLLAAKTATGTGSGEPFGIIVALDANTNVEVTPTTDGAFGAVDIDKVWKSLPERYRSRATWVMHVDVENEIRAFGSGTATSRFTVDQTRDGISLLNGRPVVVTDYFPEFTGTTGASNILVVGDFSNYLIAQRAGMSVENVPHLFDVTDNRPTGSRGIFAWARVGADSVNDLGFRLLQNQ